MLTLFLIVALVITTVVMIVLTETEQFGWATLTLIAVTALCQWLHLANIIEYISNHVLESTLYALAYLVVGVVWSFVKWFSFLLRVRDQFRSHKEKFLVSRGLDPSGKIPDDLLDNFKSIFNEGYYGRRCLASELLGTFAKLKRPRASDHKHRIVAWMSFWPFSMIGTFLTDPVQRLFRLIFNVLKALYQKMSDRVFANDVELK